MIDVRPTLAVLMVVGCSTSNTTTSPPRVAKTITGIAITGQPVKVFDYTRDQQQQGNIPDGQVTAWREADGTVDLMIPSSEGYRMRGPDLTHLTIDPTEIYSSSRSANQIPEDAYNYAHWLMGPYSLDGRTFYSISHSEWYACLLNGDCAVNGDYYGNSWVATANDFVSTDGGASWQLNVVGGNHVAAKPGYHWTGTIALQDSIYHFAFNHTGVFQPTRVIREGGYFYWIGLYIHRDFSAVDPAHGVYQAPIDTTGYILMRNADVTNPNGWERWGGPFEPQQNGTAIDGTPPQIIYDTTAQSYILIHTLYGGSNAVYYMTTQSLANPAWSDDAVIAGTATLVTDPGGPVTGFNDANYASIIDPGSGGYNFEFTGGSPMLFYSTFPSQYGGVNTARDLYRVALTVTYR
jgi:hypothetical protein